MSLSLHLLSLTHVHYLSRYIDPNCLINEELSKINEWLEIKNLIGQTLNNVSALSTALMLAEISCPLVFGGPHITGDDGN